MPFLDKTGLAHLWNHIVARLNGKAEKSDLDNLEASLTEQITNIDLSAYETKTNASSKLTEAKTYTDTKTSGLASTSSVNSSISSHNTSTSAHNDIRDLITGLTTRLNTLANSDDTTLDQMSEVVAYIKNNKSLIDGITTSKVNVSDIVDNLTTNTTNKPLSAAQGVAIKELIDALTAADTELSGITTNLSTRMGILVENYNSHVANHAPVNAQPNQNAFSNIAVSGQTTVAADTATDTVTFAGSNVSITTNATSDTVTFTVANGSTSAKGVVQLTNSTSSTSTTTAATPSSVKSAYDLANTAKTRADDAYTLADGKVGSLSDLGVTATATELNYIDGVTSNVQEQLDTLNSNKVNKSGDTMTGDLTIKADFGSVRFNDSDGNKMSVLQASDNDHTTSIYAYPTDKSTYYERYDLPTPSTGRTSNKAYKILTSKDVTASAAELNFVEGVTHSIQSQLDDRFKKSDVIPVENGGTGATDATTAIKNLGLENIVSGVVSDALYGTTLPSSAPKGQIFFKKVVE
jgi:hypothetical protein